MLVFGIRTLKLGTSDGVNVEILEGVNEEDEIKIWNKASKSDDKREATRAGANMDTLKRASKSPTIRIIERNCMN